MHFKSCRKLWKLWRVEEDSRQRKKHNDRKNTKNSFNLKLIQIINTKNWNVTKTRSFIQLKNSTRYFQTFVCSSCHKCMWGEIVIIVQEYQICTSYEICEGGLVVEPGKELSITWWKRWTKGPQSLHKNKISQLVIFFRFLRLWMFVICTGWKGDERANAIPIPKVGGALFHYITFS